MKKLGISLLTIGIISGITYLILNKKKKTSEEHKKQQLSEEEKKELAFKKMIRKNIKEEKKIIIPTKFESVEEVVKNVAEETLKNPIGIKNRNEFKGTVIRRVINLVPISKMDDVPKGVEDLEEILKKSGLYEDYEKFLEHLYSKPNK